MKSYEAWGIKGKLEVREEFSYGGSTPKSHSHAEAVRSKKVATQGVWLDVGDCGPKDNMGMLKHNLVGSWKIPLDPFPSASEMEAWAKKVWRLKVDLMVTFLNEDLFFLEFFDPMEARWVLDAGRRRFRGEMLQLDWWSPDAGCVKKKELVKEAWLRVVGLPLHLWIPRILKMIGDNCGGFLALDKDTTPKTKILWARVLVRLEGKERHSVVNILVGSQSFELQAWWELPPWSADVYPSKGDCKIANWKWEKLEEEDEGLTRASQSAWGLHDKSHYDGQNCLFEGIAEQGDKVWVLAIGKKAGSAFRVWVWILKVRANVFGGTYRLHQKHTLGWAGAAT